MRNTLWLSGRMAGWWLKKDAVIFVVALVLGSPLAAVLFTLTEMSAPDIAMTAATPLVSLYLIARCIAIWQSWQPVESPPIRHALVHSCVVVGAFSILALLVSASSWLVFGVFGPGESRPVAGAIAGIAILMFLASLGCLALHKQIVDGHRILVRPVLEQCELEVIRLVGWLRGRAWAARSSVEHLLCHIRS